MKWKKHNERRCSMIKIQNLTAGYGKTIVLSHINLELKNETYGIIGPNGSGKTTLFRVLTNSLKLKSGHISKINGVCGYLPQKFGCMPLLTVKEQLQYYKAGETVTLTVQVPNSRGEYTEQEVSVTLGDSAN
jgi:ABC-2 type transport system ATP-binding protein